MMKTLNTSNALALALVLAGAFAAQTAQAEPLARLTAHFTGRTADDHTLRITQTPSEEWKVEEILPCESYPCSIANQTRTTFAIPYLVSSPEIPDGNTIIHLDNEMAITFVNNGMVPPDRDGKRPKSYWKLERLNGNGEKEEIQLDFGPAIVAR